MPARSYAELGNELSRELDPMHLSLGELAHEIEVVAADGYDTHALRVDYYVKLSEAFACIVLPFSVLLFAVIGPPFAAPAQTLLVSRDPRGRARADDRRRRPRSATAERCRPRWRAGCRPAVFAGVVVLLAARLWKQM